MVNMLAVGARYEVCQRCQETVISNYAEDSKRLEVDHIDDPIPRSIFSFEVLSRLCHRMNLTFPFKFCFIFIFPLHIIEVSSVFMLLSTNLFWKVLLW